MIGGNPPTSLLCSFRSCPAVGTLKRSGDCQAGNAQMESACSGSDEKIGHLIASEGN